LLIFELFLLAMFIQRVTLFGAGILDKLEHEMKTIHCGLSKVYALNHSVEFELPGCAEHLKKIKIYTRLNHTKKKPNYFFRVSEYD